MGPGGSVNLGIPGFPGLPGFPGMQVLPGPEDIIGALLGGGLGGFIEIDSE
jgi:hypothetical protein